MNKLNVQISTLCLDEMGRVILPDCLIDQIEQYDSSVTAGANLKCGGTSNSACTNSSCPGTLNGACSNRTQCGQATNVIACEGATQPPTNSGCS